jgi:hypothetical protein
MFLLIFYHLYNICISFHNSIIYQPIIFIAYINHFVIKTQKSQHFTYHYFGLLYDS